MNTELPLLISPEYPNLLNLVSDASFSSTATRLACYFEFSVIAAYLQARASTSEKSPSAGINNPLPSLPSTS